MFLEALTLEETCLGIGLQNIFWQLDYTVGAWMEGQTIAKRTEVQERDGAGQETGTDLCLSIYVFAFVVIHSPLAQFFPGTVHSANCVPGCFVSFILTQFSPCLCGQHARLLLWSRE